MEIIYKPKGKALEYSSLAANIYTGCSHCCTYCWAPSVLHKSREDFTNDVKPRKDYFGKILRDCQEYKEQNLTDPVLLSFASDPYQPAELHWELTRDTLKLFNRNDIPYKILTKNTLVLRDAELFNSNAQIGFTVVFWDDKLRKKWEPNASSIPARYEALYRLHERGFKTWLSLEPVIDEDEAIKVFKEFSFVDEIKIGKINYQKSDISWEDFYYKILDVYNREKMDAKVYLKKSIMEYIEEGELNIWER